MNYGPVIFSSTWTQGMYETDKAGYVWPTGREVGGHAYLMIGWDQYDVAICQQSWGKDYGNDGVFFLTKESRQQLYAKGYWSALTVAQLAYKPKKLNRNIPAGMI
jgi:hypothetical protein